MLDTVLLFLILIVTTGHFAMEFFRTVAIRDKQVREKQAALREVVRNVNELPEEQKKPLVEIIKQNPGIGVMAAMRIMNNQNANSQDGAD